MMSFSIRIVVIAVAAVVMIGLVGALGDGDQRGGASPRNSDAHYRDKTGTITSPRNADCSQWAKNKPNASRGSLEAEGKGFEPSTGFPALDFESSR